MNEAWRSSLKVLVALKRVRDPDNVNRLRVTPDGKGLVFSGLEWKVNPFDEYALEAALRLTEDGRSPKQRRGEVVVVTFGPPDAEPKVRAALALGAERGIRVEAEDESLDGRLVARGLFALVRDEQPDLVLLGKQAVDGDSNQVGQMLAELVDWPMATAAATLREGDGCLLVEREVDGGTIRLRLRLPAVVTVDLGIVTPAAVCSRHTPPEYRYPEGVRFAPLPAVIAARRRVLTVRSLGELAPDALLTTEYLEYRLPPARSPGRMVASVSELVELLAVESKVLPGRSP
jgi:electron transfer flavoprotein beta subunit